MQKWGHTLECVCPLCGSLDRIHSLLGSGAPYPGFLQRAADRFRLVEGDLRDEVGALLRHPLGPPPPAFVPAAAPGVEERRAGGRGVPLPEEPPKTSGQEVPHPAFEKGASTPPAPTAPVVSPPKVVKQEAAGEAEENKSPVAEASGSKPEKEKKRRRRHKRDKEKKKESKKKESTSSESEREAQPKTVKATPKDTKKSSSEDERSPLPRSKGEEATPKKKKERRSSSSRHREQSKREREQKGDSRSPKRSGGKEKKVHPREEDKSWVAPANWEQYPGTTPAPKAYNSFWRGELPVSDHPRWKSGRRKGVTKVIKQELRARTLERRRWKK